MCRDLELNARPVPRISITNYLINQRAAASISYAYRFNILIKKKKKIEKNKNLVDEESILMKPRCNLIDTTWSKIREN